MINTRRTKRIFSPEFKLEAVEQALELNPDHLRKWIRLYRQKFQGIGDRPS